MTRSVWSGRDPGWLFLGIVLELLAVVVFAMSTSPLLWSDPQFGVPLKLWLLGMRVFALIVALGGLFCVLKGASRRARRRL